jgi:hypothetical protein
MRRLRQGRIEPRGRGGQGRIQGGKGGKWRGERGKGQLNGQQKGKEEEQLKKYSQENVPDDYERRNLTTNLLVSTYDNASVYRRRFSMVQERNMSQLTLVQVKTTIGGHR